MRPTEFSLRTANACRLHCRNTEFRARRQWSFRDGNVVETTLYHSPFSHSSRSLFCRGLSQSRRADTRIPVLRDGSIQYRRRLRLCPADEKRRQMALRPCGISMGVAETRKLEGAGRLLRRLRLDPRGSEATAVRTWRPLQDDMAT